MNRGHPLTHRPGRRRSLRATIIIYTLKNGISPSPTGGKVKHRLLDILGDLPRSSRIYELGSGWETLAIPIAAQFPNSSVTGYENSIVPFAVSRIRRTFSFTKNLDLAWASFFKIDLSDAALIVCYQSPGNMSNLRPKFDAELSDDVYVVSNTFAVPGWKPTETYLVNDLCKTRIYVYCVGDAKPLRPG